MRPLLIAGWVAAAIAGCTSPDLPEPSSTGATLYRERCGGCHNLLSPSMLTAAMWEFQVQRMQGEMVRRGFAPLTTDEIKVLLAYLERHAAQP